MQRDPEGTPCVCEWNGNHLLKQCDWCKGEAAKLIDHFTILRLERRYGPRGQA